MNGQWIGPYTGTNVGTAVMDLDDVGPNFAGVVFAYDNNPAFPRSFGHVELPKNKARFSLKMPLQHMERGTGLILTPELVAQKIPGVTVPTYADTEWVVLPDKISIK